MLERKKIANKLKLFIFSLFVIALTACSGSSSDSVSPDEPALNDVADASTNESSDALLDAGMDASVEPDPFTDLLAVEEEKADKQPDSSISSNAPEPKTDQDFAQAQTEAESESLELSDTDLNISSSEEFASSSEMPESAPMPAEEDAASDEFPENDPALFENSESLENQTSEVKDSHYQAKTYQTDYQLRKTKYRDQNILQYSKEIGVDANTLDDEKRYKILKEGGVHQIGLNFGYRDFPNLDYDTRPGREALKDTHSYTLSYTRYVLRKLKTGRAGAGFEIGFADGNLRSPGIVNDPSNGDFSQTGAVKAQILLFGVRTTYEANYWIGQYVVPFGSLGFDGIFVDYRFQTERVNFDEFSFVFAGGILIPMGWMEPDAARQALANGVRKTNLAVYYQHRASGDELLSGGAWHGAFRFEF